MANIMTVTTESGQRVKQGVSTSNISVSGGVKVFSNTPNAFKINDSAYQDDAVTVQAKFTLPDGHLHRDKKAELFTVGFYSPINGVCSGKKNDESRDHYYQLVNHIKDNSNQQDNSWYDAWNRRSAPLNDFVEWNGSLDSLKPFKDITLQAENTIEVMTNSKFPLNITGKLCFTFGYRVTVETNKEEWVFNNTSVDLNFVKPLSNSKLISTTQTKNAAGETIFKSDQSNKPTITVPAGISTEGVSISIVEGKDENGNIVWSFVSDKEISGEVTVTLPDPDVDPNASQSTVTRRNATTAPNSCEKDAKKEPDSYPISCSIPDGIACIGEKTANWYCNKAGFLNGNRLPTISYKTVILHTGTTIGTDGGKVQQPQQTTVTPPNVRAVELSSSCDFNDTECYQGKTPVLFVHGFTLSMVGVNLGGGKGTFGNLPKLIQDLNKDRYVLFEFRYSTEARFEDAAYDLGKAIEQIKEKTGNPVHIIAHSFGGVLTRTYLQGLAEKYMYPGEFLTTLPYKQGTVASVTTAGTPHSGIFDEKTTVGTTEFQIGQDSGWFVGCQQISCYQAGYDPIGGLDKVNFKLEDTPGYLVAKLADFAKHPLPDLPIQALIGLTATPEQICSINNPLGTPNCRATGYSVVSAGDGLISYAGQRFTPELTKNGIIKLEPLLSGKVTEKILGEFTEARKEPNDGIVKPSEKLYLTPNYQNGNGWGYRHTSSVTTLPHEATPEVEINCTSATDCQHDTFIKVGDWLATFDPFTLGFKVKNEQGEVIKNISVSGFDKELVADTNNLFTVPPALVVNLTLINNINSNPDWTATLSNKDYLPKVINLKTEIESLFNKTAVYTLIEKPVTLTFKVIDEQSKALLDDVEVGIVGIPTNFGYTQNGGIFKTKEEVKKSTLKPPYTMTLSKANYVQTIIILDAAAIDELIKGEKTYKLKAVQPTKFDVTIKACKEDTAIISRRVQICSLPLENVMVEITKDGKAVDLQLKTTGQDGRLEVSLEQGTYNIALSKDGYSNKSDTLTVSNQLEEKSFFLYSQTLIFEVLAKNADGTDANAVNVCLWSAPEGTLEVASTEKQEHSCDRLTGSKSFSNIPFYTSRTYWAQIGDDTKNISNSFTTSVSYAATNKLPAPRLEIKIPAPVSPKLTFNIVVKEKDTGNPVKTEKVCLEIAATLFRCVSVTNNIITINNVDYLPNKDYMVAAYIGNIAYTSTPISYVELPTQPIEVVIEIPVSTTNPVKPDAPVLLPAEPISDTSIKLSWKKVDNAVNYSFYLVSEIDENDPGFQDFSIQQSQGGAELGISNLRQNLNPETNYCYRVSVKVKGNSEFSEKSNRVCAKTAAKPVSGGIQTLLPLPNNLMAVSGDQKSIELKWDIIDGATKYALYKSSHKLDEKGYPVGEDTPRELLTSATNSYVDSANIEAGWEYCYSVSAIVNNTDGSDGYASQVCTISRLPMTSEAGAYITFSGGTSCFAESLSTARIPAGWSTEKFPLKTKCSDFSIEIADSKLGCSIDVLKYFQEIYKGTPEAGRETEMCNTTSNSLGYTLGSNGTGWYNIVLYRLATNPPQVDKFEWYFQID